MGRSVFGCKKPGYKAATHPVEVKTHEKPSQTGGVHIKTTLVDALREEYGLAELLARLDLARSSYFYHRSSIRVADKYAEVRRTVAEIFEDNHRSYGYRRVQAALGRQRVFLSERSCVGS